MPVQSFNVQNLLDLPEEHRAISPASTIVLSSDSEPPSPAPTIELSSEDETLDMEQVGKCLDIMLLPLFYESSFLFLIYSHLCSIQRFKCILHIPFSCFWGSL